jgi:histidinol phosphatase-like PHP family hydrolase
MLPQGVTAAELKVFFGNLHSHTSYSDGSGKPAQAYRYARDTAKLDFLAITEHNHRLAELGAGDRADGLLIATQPALYNGASASSLISAANAINQPGKFVALYGQEFSTISSGNHVNVFDVDKVIDDLVITNGHFDQLLSWLAAHHDSTSADPVVQFNHPDSVKRLANIEYGRDDFPDSAAWRAAWVPYAHLIEVLNGPGTVDQPNLTPERFESDYFAYLSFGFKLAPTGNQDNHYKNWGKSTAARTGVITDELTKAKILDALRRRHTYAVEDANLRLIFKVQGHLCGDIITDTLTPGQTLTIDYSLIDDDEPNADYFIEIFSGTVGGPPLTDPDALDKVSVHGNNSPASPRHLQDIHYTGPGQYIFFRVTQDMEHGHDPRAWTAPVWFQPSSGAAPPPPMPTEDSTKFVASRQSHWYHVSADCSRAKNIAPQNLVTGPAAAQNRDRHPLCPLH